MTTSEEKDTKGNQKLDVWLGVTIGNAGITSVFTAFMSTVGAALTFLFVGIGFAIYAWPKSKVAAVVSVVVNILVILFWDAISAHSPYGPVLPFLH